MLVCCAWRRPRAPNTILQSGAASHNSRVARLQLAATAVSYPNDFQIEHGDTEVAVKSYTTLAKGSMGSREHAFEGAQNHFVFVCDGAEEAA